MSTMTLQASLPWATSHEEDRRFRRILLQTLLISLVVGTVTPYVRIPQPDAGIAEELPPRRVRLLGEQQAPAPQPPPVQTVPAVTAPSAPQTVPERPPAAPVVTPRQKAASSGILTMSDELARLRDKAPRTGTASVQDDTVSQGHAETANSSALTANVIRGSNGIDGGVAHQSVLGAGGLPGREKSRQGADGREGRAVTSGRASAPSPGVVRSQEEIQEILDRNKGAMYALYNRELRKDATLQGKVVMSITIAPAGNVTRCVILSSGLGSASLEQQLVALIKRIDFGNKPDVPVVTTKIPIEFFPR
jgi:TonB family protein